MVATRNVIWGEGIFLPLILQEKNLCMLAKEKEIFAGYKLNIFAPITDYEVDLPIMSFDDVKKLR